MSSTNKTISIFVEKYNLKERILMSMNMINYPTL